MTGNNNMRVQKKDKNKQQGDDKNVNNMRGQ